MNDLKNNFFMNYCVTLETSYVHGLQQSAMLVIIENIYKYITVTYYTQYQYAPVYNEQTCRPKQTSHIVKVSKMKFKYKKNIRNGM